MHLLLRADASTQVGTGHVMRCLALAQAWQESGGQATFVMAASAPALEARLAAEHCAVQHLSAQPGSAADAQETLALASHLSADWVVVDGYQFGSDYQRAVKKAGFHLLFVDDYGHADHYAADLVLNQNISASEMLYASREPYTQLLLGTRFVLLRREFWPWRGWQREIAPVARHVLVTLGGSDPENATLRVVEALGQVPVDGLEAIVVVGASNPHLESLNAASAASKAKIELKSNVTNMPELMAWSDVAVSASGSTCWELAFMGVPCLIIVLAENQWGIAAGLEQARAAINLGWLEQISADLIACRLNDWLGASARRPETGIAARQMVDGRGAHRVVDRMYPE